MKRESKRDAFSDPLMFVVTRAPHNTTPRLLSPTTMDAAPAAQTAKEIEEQVYLLDVVCFTTY